LEKNFLIKPAGDCAIAIEFKNEISEEVNNRVAMLKASIENSGAIGMLECIPTYRSLTVRYNPCEISFEELGKRINEFMEKAGSSAEGVAKVYLVPVCYGGEFGPDLANVSSINAMEDEEVIKIHVSVDYRIYMMGFTPGFPYLGGLNESIATPRLKQPRTKIYAGSVGIAGKQTGIYPIDSPGGWQIIGRTPLRLFDINRKDPILLEAGNYIRFKAIDHEEYKSIAEAVGEGTYECQTETISRGGAGDDLY
jgi:KipI family sensor histidine kinase inhibitor